LQKILPCIKLSQDRLVKSYKKVARFRVEGKQESENKMDGLVRIIRVLTLIASYSFTLCGAHVVRIQTPSHISETTLTSEFVTNLKKRYQSIGLSSTANGTLTSKPFFTTTVIKEISRVRNLIVNPPANLAHYKGQELALTTEDAHTIHALYFNRNSDTLIVCAPGFGYHKEVMVPFVDLYPNYDVVIMDQRGHGLEAKAQGVFDRCARASFGIVPSLITYGEKETHDVHQLVSTLRQNASGRYKKVIGLGFCYSSLIFGKAAVQFPGLFDKLIVDGSITSLKKVFMRMQKNPLMLAHLRAGGIGPSWLQNSTFFYSMLTTLQKHLFNRAFDSELVNAQNLSKLTIPVMFVHGHQDVMVSDKEFEKLWSTATSCEKVAFLTNNRHLINHLKDKELYHHITTCFIEDTVDTCLNFIASE
jgi:pimeloyl-ACP methyl ester carboxylesterase